MVKPINFYALQFTHKKHNSIIVKNLYNYRFANHLNKNPEVNGSSTDKYLQILYREGLRPKNSYTDSKRMLVHVKDIGKNITLHNLRHIFATHSLERGTDLKCIHALLGHKCSKTTENYPYIGRRKFEQIASPIDILYVDEGGNESAI